MLVGDRATVVCATGDIARDHTDHGDPPGPVSRHHRHPLVFGINGLACFPDVLGSDWASSDRCRPSAESHHRGAGPSNRGVDGGKLPSTPRRVPGRHAVSAAIHSAEACTAHRRKETALIDALERPRAQQRKSAAAGTAVSDVPLCGRPPPDRR